MNKYFKRKIKENIRNMPIEAQKDFNKIKEIFPLNKINILGGFTRDSILQVLYGYNFPVNDLDILVETKDFENQTKSFPQENRSRFGGLKFEYKNFSMDFFGLNQIFYLRDNPNLNKNLENVLKGCDLTTSAIGFNLRNNTFHSVHAFRDIYRKEINVNPHDYLKIAPTISRLILHSDKMNFRVGDSGIKYVKENYSSELDKEIKEFLEYKKVGHLFDFVKGKVNEIIL